MSAAAPLVGEPARSRYERWGATAAMWVAGAALTLTLFFHNQTDHESSIATDFRTEATANLQSGRERIQYLQEVAYSLRRTFLTQNIVDPEEFASLANDIFSRYEGIRSLQWVEVVSAADRPEFEAQLSGRLGRPVSLRERGPDGSFRTAGERDTYWAIRFAEPLEANATVLGYDVTTAPTRESLLRAVATRQLATSPLFRLAQSSSPDDPPGVIFILPVFADTEGNGELRGFAQAVFRSDELLEPAHRGRASALLFRYIDTQATAAEPRTIYGNVTDETAFATNSPRFAEVIEVGGRRWRYEAVMNPVWRREQHRDDRFMIALGGFVITALASVLVHSLIRQKSRVESLVESRTHELRRSEAEMRAIVDNSPNAIWIKDLEGRFLLVNQRFASLYRRPREELIGLTDFDLYPKDTAEELSRDDQKVLTRNQHVAVERDYQIRDSTHIFYSVKFPLYRPDGEPFGIGGVATDITELRRMETERLEVEQRMAASQKLESLGVLAGGIAHDFNNLLTGILGNASLIHLEAQAGPSVLALASNIESAALQAAQLCEQMLAYSGRSHFVVKPVDLSSVVDETLPLVRASLMERAHLAVELGTNLPATKADLTQVRQIVMNLLINAAESLPETGGRVHVSTYSREATATELEESIGRPELAGGTYVVLRVADAGSGIAAADIERIFEPFFSTKFTGRGLGLSAVLGIVRSHQGALFVDSIVGEGTTFRLLLPTTDEPAERRLAPAPAPNEQPGLSGRRILVADDEESVRSLITMILQGLGAEVTATCDGEAAIAAFAPGRFDLAILDLTMPGRNGREVLAHLRELDLGVRVLMTSGFSETEASDKCDRHLPDGFLGKPFSVNELTAEINRLFGSPRA